MPAAPADDPVLNRFRAAVAQIYRTRLQRVVLFGSRARGDAQPNSDYDIAVFLRDLPDRAKEMARITDIETDILYDTGALITRFPSRPRPTVSAPAS